MLGARQSSENTLARSIAAREHPAQYITLDNDATRTAAREDPIGFIDRLLAGDPPDVHNAPVGADAYTQRLVTGGFPDARERRHPGRRGVRIKASASIHARDFAGLCYLRDRLGERFEAGVVLYTGERTLNFGERPTAVPLCGLWA